jgi:hydroxymethylglutaryl-CoA reductase (NADPH)
MSQNTNKRVREILEESPIELNFISNTEDAYLKAEANCENIVGSVEIPLGLAGPLSINERKVILPLATTEGCLVASINRGCKAINAAGGAKLEVERVGITRAPVFRLDNLNDGEKAKQWFEDNFELLAEEVTTTSNYLELEKVETFQEEKLFFVKFYFDSKDAMGMNMAVIAVSHLIENVIPKDLGISCIALSGNLCSDKKAAKVNIDSGRGFKAKAEVTLSEEIIRHVLKTDAKSILEVYEAKVLVGSRLAGCLGANCHHANVVAALYLATGQDPAHVVEGCLGSTIVEFEKGNLKISVNLPSIICGVVGGGTILPKQREALELMGLKADKKQPGLANTLFAENIAGAVLAGEISLLAALANNDLAKAHASLRDKN